MSTEFCIEHGYEFMRYDRPLIAYCAVCDKVAEVCAAKDARIAELEAIECPVQINIDEKAKMRIDELTAELRAARAELAEAKAALANMTDNYFRRHNDAGDNLERAIAAELALAAAEYPETGRAENERLRSTIDRLQTELAEAKVVLVLYDAVDSLERAVKAESALTAANAKIGEMIEAAEAGGLGWMPVFTRAERAEAERDAMREASDKLGFWLSAALDDTSVCNDMKRAINEWFAALASSPAGRKGVPR